MRFLSCLNFNLYKRSAIKEERCVQDNLEDDCWEMIFKLIQEHDCSDFVSLSLVCKRFLSVTSQMKITFLVSDATAPYLTRALIRFRNIRRICINSSFRTDPNTLICQISRSRLQYLEALELLYPKYFPREGLRELNKNGLKKLKCTGASLCDDDLILVSDMFPCLEELYLNCFETYEMVTTHGVEVFASKLKKLKKVTFSDCSFITDETIMRLSSNCKDLTVFEIHYCQQVTKYSIGFLMRHSSKLTSLILALSTQQSSPSNESQLTIENSISYARSLEEIEFWSVDISDDFLCSVAKSCTSLKRIDFGTGSRCNFTMRGLSTLLKACSSLKSFTPRAMWLTNEHMLQIIEHLRGLTYINLSSCSSLTSHTFFKLTQHCSLLESVVMDDTKVGFYEDVEFVLHKNYRVKHLSMKLCELYTDRALLRISRVCPYLESLDISGCSGMFTGEGMAEILRVCPQIRNLNISGVEVLKLKSLFGSGNAKLKLKTIKADDTRINDQALGVIADMCPDLEEVTFKWCHRVTENGVKLLVSNCEKLKKISFQDVKCFSKDLLDWIIATRPSALKEIGLPSGFVPSEEIQNLVLANGCLLVLGGNFVDERFE